MSLTVCDMKEFYLRNGYNEVDSIVNSRLIQVLLSKSPRKIERGIIEEILEKEHGRGQWGPETESCIKQLIARGRPKSSAIGICRASVKDR